MDHEQRAISPKPSLPGHDTPYYRNVELSVRAGRFTVVDASGTAHPLAADVIAWVVAGNGAARLLVLGEDGQVLAELPPDGWETETLAAFGDSVGVPLVEKSFPDSISGRAAYPLPKGAVRVHVKEAKAVVLQFLPVLVPVVVIIIAVLLFG